MEKKSFDMKIFTPSQIVKELDKYIIGQTEAKRAVAIAIRNRWRRQQVTDILTRRDYAEQYYSHRTNRCWKN